MTAAEAAKIMMSGGEGGKVKPITITENGVYNAPEGYVGFAPVDVNVKSTAVIQPLSVSEPGVYNASDYGCDGFDPVNVSDKYKNLYEQALGLGENIDTGITDPDGNEIVLDNAIETDWDIVKCITLNEGSAAITCPSTGLQLKLFVHYSDPQVLTDGNTYVTKYLGATMTNLTTGQTVTYDNILRGGYRTKVTEKLSVWFTVENYKIYDNGLYFQFYPGRVWRNGELWGGAESWFNSFFEYFYSTTVGIPKGFVSPVYFQAVYA